jgi:large subunit ribosomal protein L4e
MAEVDVISIDGTKKGAVALPSAFNESVRPELILRAVNAENSLKMQPQGHYPLAGMDTTAKYYGAMNSYRTGRHMGIAIRPRQKLASGIQGAVRRIPSSVKGKRAHPHVIEKIMIEGMNKKEYRKAVSSAVAATVQKETGKPIVVANDIESVSKTKQMIKLITAFGLASKISGIKKNKRKGLRRSSTSRRYTKALLLVVSKEAIAIKAARNIKGVDACAVDALSANSLAPGGRPGRAVIWSEGAIGRLDSAIERLEIGDKNGR